MKTAVGLHQCNRKGCRQCLLLKAIASDLHPDMPLSREHFEYLGREQELLEATESELKHEQPSFEQ